MPGSEIESEIELGVDGEEGSAEGSGNDDGAAGAADADGTNQLD